MIKEDYVSYETAKFLKEKGFEGRMHTFYTEEGTEIESAYVVPSNFFPIYRPTLQMAMKWLEEVHNILLIPDYVYECTDKSWCYKVYHLDENGKPERVAVKGVSYDKDNNPTEHVVYYRDYERSYKDYFTKEEAIEEGIKYCLGI